MCAKERERPGSRRLKGNVARRQYQNRRRRSGAAV